MGREKNIESIRILEKQIKMGDGDIIKLKRARNSLLNISICLPPEILGFIFVWTVAQEREDSMCPEVLFGGLERGSYSFLLVCHHWFKVASNTPELWSFWGNTLQDWEKMHRRAGVVPIDLVMSGSGTNPQEVPSAALRATLRNRATKDKVRRIHLQDEDTDRMALILSWLTPGREETSEKCIESIALWGIPPKLSDFFARSRLQKLQRLDLSGTLSAPVWDHLTPHTTRLTVLSLKLADGSFPPTTSQLLSVLASNPNLRELQLADKALPKRADGSGIRLSLPHLKTVDFCGGFNRVFGLLNQLELPAKLDYMDIKTTNKNCTIDEILRTVGPQLQDRFRRDIRFQNKLEVCISFERRIQITVFRANNHLGMGPELEPVPPYVRFSTSVGGVPPPDPVMKRLPFDLMALVPREHVAYLKMYHCLESLEEVLVATPNIETLSLRDFTLSEGFLQPSPKGPYANTKLLPSLRLLRLTKVATDEAGWKPLVSYLAHQTSSGQVISLDLYGGTPIIPWELVKEVQDLVTEFVYRGHEHGDLSSRESYLFGWGGGL
jgi:hypothetical protein